MTKIKEFLKTNIEFVKWTIEYFFILWLILQYVFKFDVFSLNHWWKFFHASFHGFAGFVFAVLMYTAIPIYIATSINVYKNKASLIKIPFIDKIIDFIKTKFFKPAPAVTEDEKEENKEEENESEENIFPSDMPPELKVPYIRAKNHQSLMGAVSVYNKTDNNTKTQNITEPTADDFPIPTDFDLSFDNDTPESSNDFQLNTNEDLSIPQFKDINFDDESTTQKEENKLENFTTKYFDAKHIHYETLHEFVMTAKNLIYEHSDEDFWIMDDDTWFAAGKQKESPILELLSYTTNTPLIPTIYLRSQNIMDIDETIKKFESMGIRVIKNLEELD